VSIQGGKYNGDNKSFTMTSLKINGNAESNCVLGGRGGCEVRGAAEGRGGRWEEEILSWAVQTSKECGPMAISMGFDEAYSLSGLYTYFCRHYCETGMPTVRKEIGAANMVTAT
jgi:hypothetical protein